MRLIEAPPFAPDNARQEEVSFYDGVTLSMYHRVQAHRAELLAAAHGVLEAYFDRMGLPDADSFPYLGALTGEYYWDRREGYSVEGVWRVRAMLRARCLGRRGGRSKRAARDYCGVDVWLVFDPETGRFEEYYTGHKVI
jgi:hypothetical protein